MKIYHFLKRPITPNLKDSHSSKGEEPGRPFRLVSPITSNTTQSLKGEEFA